jgi:nitroreductase
LEVRAEIEPELWAELAERFPPNTFFVGLTSIHWREAWKYGKRAYRYCQHDAGHAIGAVGIAAAGLGWQTRILDEQWTDALASLMGTDGEHDAEAEEPDVLMAMGTFEQGPREAGLTEEFHLRFRASAWQGHPNQLSPSHEDWGVDEIAKAARQPHQTPCYESAAESPRPCTSPVRPISLRRMIRQRRSAVAMDAETHLSRDTFYRILQKTLPVPGSVPFEALPWKPHIHLAIFVHRVEDLSSGLYFLVRDPTRKESLQQAITRADQWRRPPGCPAHLDLFLLVEGDARNDARQISCFQEIASDSSFSLGMIAEYEEPLKRYGPWFYPRLFWEAGAIGQVLYLEAEAAGVRSTGIGCFFDDPMHDLLGLKDRKFQDLYHFTIGGPVEDTRLTTLPAYPEEAK